MVETITQTKYKSIPRDNALRKWVYETHMSINPKTGKNFTFEEIGKIKGFTKQRANQLYWSYVKANKVFYTRGGDL